MSRGDEGKMSPLTHPPSLPTEGIHVCCCAPAQCIAPFAASLSPATALALLQAVQADVGAVDAALPALASNYSALVVRKPPHVAASHSLSPPPSPSCA
jgi:hypothetical protein